MSDFHHQEAPIERNAEVAPASQAKEDPASFELRARPRPVARFRRAVVIGAAGAVSTALIAMAWLALAPSGFGVRAASEEAEPLRKGAPEALANAPASYGDVPRLGPPLPGDLGRPILAHERQATTGGGVTHAITGARMPDAPGPASAGGVQERLASELLAARRSNVTVHLTSTTELAAGSAPGWAATGGAASSSAADAGGPAPAAGGARQRKMDFAPSAPGTSEPRSIEGARSPWTLSAGTVIPASLLTGLDSDLPGAVFAQVTENVFDSATGRTLLIPQGSRLVGTYDSVVAYGQRRAVLVWQRLLLPNGASVQLDNVPASDSAGYAGVSDKVDSHSWRLLKGIVLSSLLGVGGQARLSASESDLARAVRESFQQNGSRAGEQIVVRNLDVQPTIRIRPGYRLLAVLHKDLVLRPWKG
jgi:type IV secretory pathway VirB10-like protein